MKKQVFNPYLPGWEYIPDGEPKLFDGRVYIFGSHDAANGTRFCMNDYVAWSAPETDLSDWRYEGVIYRKEQHPHNGDELPDFWAPDVVRGTDGKYYLYYSVANSSIISVAVCDTPAGAYVYLGDVHEPDGHVAGSDPEDYFEFDPAVLVDTDGRVWLYSGSGQKSNERWGHPVVGCFVRELEPDMITIKSGPCIVLRADWDLKKPSFFEGASIRRIGDLYYLVYPASNMTGLNYAISRYPDRGFRHMGIIHSTSDVGYKGITIRDSRFPLGNNHGGIVQAAGQWYVFDHRMTNHTMFSRQGVAEKIEIAEDGTIEMVEATSCGLNDGPLAGKGVYPAYIACNLMAGGLIRVPGPLTGPYIHQDEPDYDPDAPSGEEPQPYIAGIAGGSRIGFKYFDFQDTSKITVTMRGKGIGDLIIQTEENGGIAGTIKLRMDTQEWTKYSADMFAGEGEKGLFFTFKGQGNLEMLDFEIE